MKIINRILVILITILMASFVFTMTANIIMRYFFSYSLVWSEEFARYSFIWVAMFGACLAFIRNEHLGFDLLVANLKHPIKQIVDAVNHVLVLAFLILFGYQGALLSLQAGATPSQSMKIPMGLVYIALPLSAAIMIIFLAPKVVATFKELRGSEASPTQSEEA